MWSCNSDGSSILEKQKDSFKISYQEKGISIDYLVLENKESLIRFKVTVHNSKNFKQLINEEFKINLGSPNLYDEISSQITEKQRNNNDFSASEIENISTVFTNMINSKTDSISRQELRSMKLQGLFVCNSLVKSIKRLTYKSHGKKDTYITNTVYGGFKRGMSSFILNEDLMININDLTNNRDKNQSLRKKEDAVMNKILKSINKSNISFQELLKRTVKYMYRNPNDFEKPIQSVNFKGKISDTVSLNIDSLPIPLDNNDNVALWWPKGSDHGCCGNYSGPCYYWDLLCWVHDKMCTDCTPRWFCFEGCVPD